MKYRSTRGKVEGLSFEEALYSGFAADGGILLPERIPRISSDTLKTWATLSYVDLVKKIVPLFVEDEIPETDLNELIDRAFSRFSHPDVAPITRLSNGLNVMELFHGVTWAFKDLGLSCVGQFVNYFLSKRKKHLCFMIATSGDTGSAAIEAVKGSKWADIIVMLPRGRISRVQELQMITVLDSNVHVYRVDGTSDDLDDVMRACFADLEFTKKNNLSCLNSINFSRILIQIVHYFYAYLQMCPTCDQEVEIAVPTGAGGNVTSGCIARAMGLPLKLVCCVTKNDTVARTLDKGDYSLTHVTMSLAPAMDIQVAYNMERIWYLFSDGDVEKIDEMMKEFDSTKKTKVPDKLKNEIAQVISSHVVPDEEIKASMRRCWEENNYLVCPHTATAVNYHYTKHGTKGDNPLRVCLASASPAKFEESVTAAGLTFTPTEGVKKLLDMPTRYLDLEQGDDWTRVMRAKVEELTKKFQASNS